MVIQHNISAINSHRNMGINNGQTSKNLEKLSSGYRINRAADDAAGLAISEKMRGQIRGLGMAEQNTSHGINLIQTAEGALNETHAILQRMRELAVQSSNGTYQDEDRVQLTKEFDALKSEVDRIAESTHYNNIKLLDGSLGGGKNVSVDGKLMISEAETGKDIGTYLDIKGISVAKSDASGLDGTAIADGAVMDIIDNGDSFTFKLNGEDASKNALVYEATVKKSEINNSGATSEFTVTLTSLNKDSSANVVNMTFGSKTFMDKLDGAENIQLRGLNFTTGTGKVPLDKAAYSYDAKKEAAALADVGVTIGTQADFGNRKFELSVSDINAKGDMNLLISMTDDDGKTVSKSVTINEKNFDKEFEVELGGDNDTKFKLSLDGTKLKGLAGNSVSGKTDSSGVVDTTSVKFGAAANKGALVFQIGANGGADQRVSLSIANMGSKFIGDIDGDMLSAASISDRDSANAAIDTIEAASRMVSGQRADLGALQNRLESTMNSLGVTKENLTAAESTIRDVDMAKEMMEFTKNNILVQASQSMLAQANQLPQGVLSLLR